MNPASRGSQPSALTIPSGRRRETRRRASSRWALLALAVFLPPGLFTVANTTSMAAGAALCCLLCILLRLHPLLTARARLAELHIPALIIALLCLHAVLVFAMQPFDVIRYAASICLLVIFAAGSHVLRREIFDQPALALDKTCNGILLALSALVPVAVLELVPAALFDKNKLIFPFPEPSVFALAGMPFLAYACVRATGWHRIALVLGAALVAYLVKNLTMFAGLTLLVAICLRPRAALLVALVVVAGALMLDISYFSERSVISAESENLSSLVFLQGWQLMEEGLTRSAGLGIGFQQLGMQPTAVAAAEIIYAIGETDLNLKDGGFLLAKIVSEFGVFGIALAIWFVGIAFGCARSLRHAAMSGVAPPHVVFAQCLVVFFSIDVFVRGAGYFSGTSLLCLAALQQLHYSKNPRAQSAAGLPKP